MAHLIQVPIFQPANPAQVTLAEWMAYKTLVNATDFQLQVALTVIVLQHVHPALPPEFLTPPTTSTQRLQAANLATAHLHTVRLQLVMAQNQAALNLAHTQAMPHPPPVPAAPARIKTAPPAKYDGKAHKANTFLAEWDNYYVLNPMADDQRIRFALQYIEGDRDNWKKNQLHLLTLAQPLAHFATWDAFKAEFWLQFANPQEREKATSLLLHGRISQTTSVRNFIDQIQEQCDKAGYLDPAQQINFVKVGLKPEVTRAMAGHTHATYQDFVWLAVMIDKDLQRIKEKERGWRKPLGSGLSKPESKGSEKPKADNSKYKLSDEDKKEHIDGHLCFKCHKTGHGSKECKNLRTVYSEVKKVASIEGKEKGIDEDFSDSN